MPGQAARILPANLEQDCWIIGLGEMGGESALDARIDMRSRATSACRRYMFDAGLHLINIL